MALTMAIETIFMLPPLFISLFSGEGNSFKGFLVTILISLVLESVLFLLCKGAPRIFGAKDGFVCVTLSWVVLSIVGSLPFVISGEIPSFVDALFETVSGFSTTGASILSDVESLSKGLLYWRSFTHWLGGMGVLVFLLALTSSSGKEGGFTMHLLRAESPGPDVGKLVPRMRTTAIILYLIYIGLSLLNLIFLLAGGMPLFDALCTMFGTAGTGGFGIKNSSLADYSTYIQVVTTVFMFLFGINFSCYFFIILRQFKPVFKDEELRLYVGIVITAIVLITINIYDIYGSVGESLLHSSFQVSSIITTTGYATTDFDLWPAFSKAILFCLMAIGACAGSTGGGLKCVRVLILLKSLRRNIRRIIQPKKVIVVRSNDKVISERVLDTTNAYFAAYAMILVASFVIISIDGFSLTTNISAVMACFNNIGPGFDAVGATCNFGGYGILSKLVLIFDMLAGRLEIFPILALFSSSTWRHK
jgi:trk system potassium uptake protein TrkH